MSFSSRQLWSRSAWAAALIALPLQLPAKLSIGAPLAVPFTLALLALPLFWTLERDRNAAAPDRIGTATLVSGVAAALALVRPGLDAGAWILCGVLAVALLSGILRFAPPRPDPASALAILVLVGFVVWRPHPLNLASDAPGHATAILDALERGVVLPPDVFPGAGSGGTDPRFGILHGIYAMVARWSAAEPADVLRWSAILWSPLWFLVHRMLFRRLGMGARLATATAFLFTLHAGPGRGFGLAASGFPGSVAQIAVTFALVGLLDSRDRVGWTALGLAALSVVLHPFGWWSLAVVLLVAGALFLLDPGRRVEGRLWLLRGVLVLPAGTALLLPKLLHRASSANGLHDQLNEVVRIGGGLFVADPFWVFRWGGTGAVLALPLLIALALADRAWWSGRNERIGLALAAPVWLISFNPLAAPVAWPLVSYLVVRLGRIVITTWVWGTLLVRGFALRGGGRRRTAGLLLALAGALGLAEELRVATLHLRQPQVIDAAGVEGRLDEMSSSLARHDLRWLVAAPRIGYGLRARGGPPLVLPPVAHANPNDTTLLDRIAAWRRLQAADSPEGAFFRDLARFGGAGLLVDTRTERVHAGLQPYAYVPDDGRSNALLGRLRAAGIPVLEEGDGWVLFALPGELARDWGGPGPGDAPSLSIDGVRLSAARVRRGGSVDLELDLRAEGPAPAIPERIFVRLEGPVPRAPEGLGALSKLWRKLLLERSGRSGARFGTWVVPTGLTLPQDTWPGGVHTERAELKVPPWIEPGRYSVQVTVHPWTWHGSHDLADYLSDTDRFSGPERAAIEIVD